MSFHANPHFSAAATSEESARSPDPATKSTTAPKVTPADKLRSCKVCRLRKVRCDKQSPCSNCRRANIACVIPSNNDRPPRWARRLERVANDAATNARNTDGLDPASAQVMDRLRNLESLVKELSGQLEVANAAASSTAGDSSGIGSPQSTANDQDMLHSSSADPGSLQKHFGRLVVKDANRSRYVSSGFWSRVNDELDGLKMESQDLPIDGSDTSDEDVSSAPSAFSRESTRTPLETHGFLFRHNINPQVRDLAHLHPLPSQIPFILNAFSDNVNVVIRLLHMPTVTNMIRTTGVSNLSPSNEALVFSIYYATVSSMEDEDIRTNFGVAKEELCLKYRSGLEYALAKADFLKSPDLILLQAFVIFLCLLRRHDSPRFVWMMTGLAIRMGQALGLQRDPAQFKQMTPYDVEMRRRLWWGLVVLDSRASEDQGTEFTIQPGSFDVKFPLNINDADIAPEMTVPPVEHIGITDITMCLVTIEMGDITTRIMADSAKSGRLDPDAQDRMLAEIYEKVESGYLKYAMDSEDILAWVGVCVARLVMAKMTLLTYLPPLFTSQDVQFSDRIRSKLLVAAIEIAEYNHALNAEQRCRHWRWVFQTYTHWYSIVYLLLETCRRPWSPLIERAWTALHSQWLIPPQNTVDKHQRIWIPLRKLMAKARRHREEELKRLRGDKAAASDLEAQDRTMPHPLSPAHFPAGANPAELFRQQWRALVAFNAVSDQALGTSGFGPAVSPSYVPHTHGHNSGDQAAFDSNSSAAHTSAFPSPSLKTEPLQNDDLLRTESYAHALQTVPPSMDPSMASTTANIEFSQNITPAFSNPIADSTAPGFVPWLWSSPDSFANLDLDINMDFGGEMDWNSWIESAQGAESGLGFGNGFGGNESTANWNAS